MGAERAVLAPGFAEAAAALGVGGLLAVQQVLADVVRDGLPADVQVDFILLQGICERHEQRMLWKSSGRGSLPCYGEEQPHAPAPFPPMPSRGDPTVGGMGEGVPGLTCPAGEVHTAVASGIQYEREATEAVVGAVRVQTLAVDAVHFVLALILICPCARTEQSQAGRQGQRGSFPAKTLPATSPIPRRVTGSP